MKAETISCILCSKKFVPGAKSVALLCPVCEDQQRSYLVGRDDVAEYIPPNEIEEGVFLGGQNSAVSEVGLKSLKIKNILIVGRYMKQRYPGSFNYKQVEIDDDEDENILVRLDVFADFIAQSRTKGEGVLVHCLGGVSRSASAVIGYVMRSRKWGMERALAYVQSKRSCVHPNPGFIRQLKEYEKCIEIVEP